MNQSVICWEILPESVKQVCGYYSWGSVLVVSMEVLS